MIILLLAQLVLSAPSYADDSKVKVENDTSKDQDTAVLVHKGSLGNGLINPPTEYQIVDGSDDILGDPSNDAQESLKSWKNACDDWKKELKANNGDRLIVANCGRPHIETERVTYQKTNVSTGTYKIKVLVREASPAQH